MVVYLLNLALFTKEGINKRKKSILIMQTSSFNNHTLISSIRPYSVGKVAQTSKAIYSRTLLGLNRKNCDNASVVRLVCVFVWR